MKSSKLHIFYYFIRFRWSRWLRSNRVSNSILKRWKRNLQQSPFYAPLLEAGAEFPIMNKQRSMDHFNEINTVHISKAEAMELAVASETSRNFSPTIGSVAVGLSSGTSGNKGLFLTSPKERAQWVGAVLDRVIGFSLKKRQVAFFLRANNQLYEAVNSSLLRFHFFDLKTPVADHLPHLLKLEADILVAQPSVLFTLARLYQREKHTSSFRKVISVAEVLEADQQTFFEEVFQCPITQVYQCTEGFLAHTCKLGSLHFNEDWLTIEKHYLDESKQRYHPIITDHLRMSQPVIRYELNDILHEGAPCSCGLKSTVIGKIEGRSDDVFRFQVDGQEVLLYPDFIRRAVITSSDAISNYVVTLMDAQTVSLAIETTVDTSRAHAFNQASLALQNFFMEMGISNITIVDVPLEHQPMHKFKRIHNAYQKTL